MFKGNPVPLPFLLYLTTLPLTDIFQVITRPNNSNDNKENVVLQMEHPQLVSLIQYGCRYYVPGLEKTLSSKGPAGTTVPTFE